MPFSRSRSPESITRSTTAWFARKAPVWRSIASTSVVLPWSTWATMATLRRSPRVAAEGRLVEARAVCAGVAVDASSVTVEGTAKRDLPG